MLVKKYLIAAYFISLHLIIGFLIIKTNFLEKLEIKLGRPTPEISEHYLEMLHFHSRIDQSLPENSVLFIGDSHIQSLYNQMDGYRSVNFGIGNDTTMGVRERLSSYSSLETAKAVVFQIGINDLEYRSVNHTLRSYKHMIQQLPQNIPILINAVFPVSELIIADGRNWNREVSELNRGLQALCEASKRCRFLDLEEIFLDKTGNLDRKFHIGDGVHLSSVANEIWRAAIYRELKQFE